MIFKIHARIINYIRNKYSKHKLSKLKNKNFSLIANNCNGGLFLNMLGLRFNSPFVNLWIQPWDYIKMLESLNYYMSCELSFTQEDGITYPIGLLDNIKIYFMHYESEAEAKHKWEERSSRMNYDNLFIMFTYRHRCTEEHLIDFDNLNYKNKVILINKPCKKIKSAVYIKNFKKEDVVGDCIMYKNFFSYKRPIDNFNYIKWLNQGITF